MALERAMHATILILDFGAQYTQLIARRVRELDVYCEIHPFDVPGELIRELKPAGIILSGGPESVTEGIRRGRRMRYGRPACRCSASATACRRWRRSSVAPWRAGACVSSVTRRYGRAGTARLLEGIQDRANPEGHGLLDVWMSHGDKVTALPPGFELMAGNEATPIAGMMDESRRFYAVQFHPEVTHTKQGRAILDPLRARDLRLQRRLDHAGLRRRGGGQDPQRGGGRGSDPRALRRRRFVGCARR